MCPIQRSDYSVSLYTTTTIQYILYNVIIQLWGVITMVNLFLVYFPALLLYTTTIQYIHTYSGGIGNSKLSKVLRETNHIYPALLLYTTTTIQYILYNKNSSAKKGWGVLSPIYYYYILYSIRGRIPLLGGKFFLKKAWKYGFFVVSLWGGVYIKKVSIKLDSRMWKNLT